MKKISMLILIPMLITFLLVTINVSAISEDTPPEAGTSSGFSSTVHILNGPTHIDDYLFYNYTSLSSISIPSSVTSIGMYAFYGCNNLTTVFYRDTKEKWEEILIGDGNEPLLNAKKIFLEEEGIYKYKISNGEAIIEACDMSANGEIEIPSTLGGYPVTCIASGSFTLCNNLTSIKIPSSIKCIENGAFRECQNLAKILVDSDNNYYSSPDNVLFDKTETSLICCPEGKYGNYILPDSVINIENLAFFNAKISSLTISKNVTSIDDGAFIQCDRLSEIIVASDNQYFMAEDNVLFNKDKTTLIRCGTRSGTYIIPNGVKVIADNSFRGLLGLTNVVIPDSVTDINECAFYKCTNLTSITIPESVEYIDFAAFEECTVLEAVYYNNSQTSWAEIQIGNCNDPLINAMKFFLTDDTISTDAEGTLMVTGYTPGGRLINLKQTDGGVINRSELKDCQVLKAYVWDMETMTPLCKPVVIE